MNGVQSPIVTTCVLEKPQEENVHLEYEDHHMAYKRSLKKFLDWNTNKTLIGEWRDKEV